MWGAEGCGIGECYLKRPKVLGFSCSHTWNDAWKWNLGKMAHNFPFATHTQTLADTHKYTLTYVFMCGNGTHLHPPFMHGTKSMQEVANFLFAKEREELNKMCKDFYFQGLCATLSLEN